MAFDGCAKVLRRHIDNQTPDCSEDKMAPGKSDLTAVENKGEKNGCLSFAILPPPYQLLQLLPLAAVWWWYVTVVSELGVGDRSYLEPRIVVRAMLTPPRCSQVPAPQLVSLGKIVTCVLNRRLN